VPAPIRPSLVLSNPTVIVHQKPTKLVFHLLF